MYYSIPKPTALKIAQFLFFVLITCSITAQVKTPFTPRFSESVNGDITIIANNMVSDTPTGNYTQNSNNNFPLVFVDIDSDASTFNSSSANLSDPSPTSACLEFKRAYLYWAAANKEYGTNGDGNTSGNGSSEPSWSYNQVKLMLPGSNSYNTITADEVIYNGRAEHFSNDPYICIKDITTDIQNLANPYGKFQVANVKVTEGTVYEHSTGSQSGTSGGWQIVFIYESPDLKRRNVTLFDGYAHVTKNQNSFNVEFNGFQTVPNGPVNANLVLGSLEGDRTIDKDALEIYDTNGDWTPIYTNERSCRQLL